MIWIFGLLCVVVGAVGMALLSTRRPSSAQADPDATTLTRPASVFDEPAPPHSPPGAQRTEQTMREYRAMIESAKDAIFLVERGTFIEFNAAAEALFRLPRSQLQGARPGALSPEFQPDGTSSHEAAKRYVERALSGESCRFHWVHLRGDGTPFTAEVTLAPAMAQTPGEAPRFVSVVRDVTEQLAAQQALKDLNNHLEDRVAERTRDLQQAMDDLHRTQAELVRSEKLAGLGALVAGMAHELNTPIGNAVIVASTLADQRQRFAGEMAEGVRKSSLNRFMQEVHEGMDVLSRNLQRAAELIAGFKQVAVDQSSHQRRPCTLDSLVHEVHLTLTPTLRRGHVQLQADVAEGLHLDSFPGPLAQVLTNIVNNAVVHAFEQQAEPRITVTGMAHGEGMVRLQVRDNGCGIAPEYLERVFDPFFTTRLGRGGSGLGMHIVYSLVTELLGGTIHLDSTPGQGTTVTLTLPAVAPAVATEGL
jgi:PAS domain S-box-containing protein